VARACRLAVAALVALLGLLPAGPAAAAAPTVSLDLRAVWTDADDSFLQGGLGRFRFDDEHRGLRLGRLRLALEQPLGEIASLTLDASAWDPKDAHPLDLTEAFVELRPFPRSAWRQRVRAGAFYAPLSLEHRAAGWTNPYFLTSSAINTWYGEELRTIGVEYRGDWLGTHHGRSFDLGLVAAVYGFNDPAGVVLASRGFALHDRQTTLFQRLGRRGLGFVPGRVLFQEIDGRPGYYAGVQGRYLDRGEARLLHYDNRGDPAVFDDRIGDGAWHTKFDAAGLRLEPAADWTVIAQWLEGTTSLGAGDADLWRYEGAFALASRAFGTARVSARAEQFRVTQLRSDYGGYLVERGRAFALGWQWDVDAHVTLAAEAVQVSGTNTYYGGLGDSPYDRARQFQLSARLTL
jgi:hypothetical protein